MAVQDDLRRLSQLDSIYLGNNLMLYPAGEFTSWHKGRLQQANDGSWIFRSISQEGTIVGFQFRKPRLDIERGAIYWNYSYDSAYRLWANYYDPI